MTGTTIFTGVFVSVGGSTTISLPFGADWIEVWNGTNIDGNVANGGRYWYQAWNNGINIINGQGLELQGNAGATAVNYIAGPVGAFSLTNTSTAVPGAPVALTAISNAAPPVVATGSTVGLSTNNGVVEIINTTGAQQLGGMTFSVGTVIGNTSFTLKYMPAIVAGTNGFYRIIPFDPIFYPRRRFITAITTGATTQIRMSVDTTYTVGQLVRVVVPAAYGSISQNINGLTGTIQSIVTATNTVTVDINSTGMGTFTFPLTAAVPFTQAQLSPVGSDAPDAGETSNTLLDATLNTAIAGITLQGGTLDSPGGQNGDVIYWRAGSTFQDTGNVY